MTLLARYPVLRKAFVVGEQLVCAAIIFALAGVVWKALGDGRARPGVVTVLVATAVVAVVLRTGAALV